MRIKEFLIFLLIFTIIYILFFLVYDYINNLKINKKSKEKALTLINIDSYNNFARFYGLSLGISKELILNIYDDIKHLNSICISEFSKKYNISVNVFIVIIIYLEYIELLGRKSISIESDSINELSSKEGNMVFKYSNFFKIKGSIEAFISSFGDISLSDLIYIDKFFLFPGVRYIDSKIYYVGD